jgi:hypothetical protein
MPDKQRDRPLAPRPLRVDCYAGYRGEETPRRFRLAGAWLEVEKVVDRWWDPDHRYFSVHAADGHTYVLRHDAESQRWELAPYPRDRD